MSKISDEFGENINYLLQNSKNQYCENLQKNNLQYRSLLRKLHKFFDNLLKGQERKFELEDEFFDYLYEFMNMESMYLYKQGYKDCFKLWRMLDE